MIDGYESLHPFNSCFLTEQIVSIFYIKIWPARLEALNKARVMSVESGKYLKSTKPTKKAYLSP
jgi:hypothetical protein